MPLKNFRFSLCFIALMSSFSNAEIITKKELSRKIEKIAASNEIIRIKELINDNSSAVVLIHTISRSAGDDGLIYNSSIKKRSKKHHYNHGITTGVMLSKDGVICATHEGTMNSDEIIVSIDSELRDIQDNSDITLTKNDYKAKIIKAIPELNLTFFKIRPRKGETFKYLNLGNDSSLLNADDKVLFNGAVVIGKAKGENFVTVSKPANSKNNFDIFSSGIERLTYKKIEGTPTLIIENSIIGDSVIPENDGGVIIGLDGKLIGIATVNKDDFSKSSATAIPVSVIKQGIKIAVPSLIDNGINTSFGIKVKDCVNLKMSKSDILSVGIPELKKQSGVIVETIGFSSIADNSGIQIDDIILKFNDDFVRNSKTFENLEKNSIGFQNIVLKILRNGKIFDIEINR